MVIHHRYDAERHEWHFNAEHLHENWLVLCMKIRIKSERKGFSNPEKTKGPFNNRMTLGPAEREIVASPRGLEPLLPP